MVLDQDLLALADQAFPRAVVQVQVDAVLFLSQTRLGLLHVLGDRVVADELLRLGLVVRLGRGEERLLERFAVNVEVLSVRIRLVEPERDLVERKESQPGEASARAFEGIQAEISTRTERIHDFFDQVRLDRLAIPLLFDQLEHGVRQLELLLHVQVEVIFPRHEREL